MEPKLLLGDMQQGPQLLAFLKSGSIEIKRGKEGIDGDFIVIVAIASTSCAIIIDDRTQALVIRECSPDRIGQIHEERFR